MAPVRRSQKGQKGKAYKIAAVEHYLTSGKSMEAVATEYGVTKSCLFLWKQKHDNLVTNGIDDFHDEGGRPKAIDEIGMNALKSQHIDRKRKQNLPSRAEMKGMINAQAAATLARRGKGDLLPSLSRPTRQHIHEDLQQKIVKGQRKQHARIAAEKDPRNFFTAIAMTKAFAGQLQPHMVMNFDATQFVVGGDTANDVVVDIVSGNQDLDKLPATSPSKCTLPMAIKYYHLHNAAGVVAPAVMVVADDKMKEESLVVHGPISGFTNDVGIEGKGYLCITKTRCCNAAFYRWYNKTIICPFVDQCRTFNDAKYPDGSWMRAYVTCDGEAKQIEIFQEDLELQRLGNSQIDLGKLPASCSGVLQPSDVSPFFKAMKKRLKSSTSDTYRDGALDKRLREILKAGAQAGCGLTNPQQKKLVDGLLLIISCLKETVKPDMIRAGYKDSGLWPISLECALKRCTTTISTRLMQRFDQRLDEAADMYRNTGQLTEQEMTDDLGLPDIAENEARKLPKDERVLYQQRAAMMNTAEAVNRYRTRKALREREAEWKPFFDSFRRGKQREEQRYLMDLYYEYADELE